MSNPVELLYQEHQVIKKALSNVLGLKNMIIENPENYKLELKNYIGFFRNYADKFHHQKEENILFPEMGKKKEHLGDGVIQEMLDNHSDFREMLADIESLNNAGEFDESFKKFEKYNHELLNHIAVEDDEVFQMALSILDSDDLDKIYFRFLDTDSNLGMDNKLAMEKMVN